MNSSALCIGEVALRAGVSIDAVRYYERRRLLPAAPRTMAVKLAYVFFALFLLTGVAFPQAPNKRERTMTISVHIDGFMKSKSGSV
jgi:hypothetical protein